MAPISGIATVNRAAALYGRQQFYANRASQIKNVKTYQVGAEDRVTISPEAAGLTKDIAPKGETIRRRRPEQAITYENPRKSAMNSAPKPAEAPDKVKAQEPETEAAPAV